MKGSSGPNPDPRSLPSTAVRHEHIDGASPSRLQIPKRGRRPVTQDRVLTTRDHGGEEEPQLSGALARRISALMESVQLSTFDPSANHPIGDTGCEQLARLTTP